MEAIKIGDEYRRVFTTPNNNKYCFNKSSHRKYLNKTQISKIEVRNMHDISEWSLDINFNNRKRMDHNLAKFKEDDYIKSTMFNNYVFPILEHKNEKKFIMNEIGDMIQVKEEKMLVEKKNL